MKRKVPESVGACFELIEREFCEGPWVMGESYSICDPYLYTMTRWLPGDGVDVARFPKIAQHAQAIVARPLVQKAIDQHFA